MAYTLSLSANHQYRVTINPDGIPVNPLSFKVNCHGTFDDEGYRVDVVITRHRPVLLDLKSREEWKSTDPYLKRKDWYFYRINVAPKTGITTVAVDSKWIRDIARFLNDKIRSVSIYCVIMWEDSDGTQAEHFESITRNTVEITLINDLLAFNLTTSSQRNNSANGAHHEQRITVSSSGHGYGIVQWVKGTFLRWKEDSTYNYLKIPSGGVDVDGYMPQFILDGSRSSGIPNFFDVQSGMGIDLPGDLPQKPKEWKDYKSELMLLQFVTRVYLAADVDGVSCGTFQKQDVHGKVYLTTGNFRFNPKIADFSAGSTLKPLAEGKWAAGILQQGSQSMPVCEEDLLGNSQIPDKIQKIIQEVFKNTAEIPPNVSTE